MQIEHFDWWRVAVVVFFFTLFLDSGDADLLAIRLGKLCLLFLINYTVEGHYRDFALFVFDGIRADRGAAQICGARHRALKDAFGILDGHAHGVPEVHAQAQPAIHLRTTNTTFHRSKHLHCRVHFLAVHIVLRACLARLEVVFITEVERRVGRLVSVLDHAFEGQLAAVAGFLCHDFYHPIQQAPAVVALVSLQGQQAHRELVEVASLFGQK